MQSLKEKIRKLAQSDSGVLEGLLLLAESIDRLEGRYYKLFIESAKNEGYVKGLGESIKMLSKERGE